MKTFTRTLTAAALLLCGSTLAGATSLKAPSGLNSNFDITSLIYKGKQHADCFQSAHMQQVAAANAILERGKTARFGRALMAAGTPDDVDPNPTQQFPNSELHGDMDGPDGRLWFYSGTIDYETVVHNEYFTEYLPVAFTVTFYNPEMQPIGNVHSKLTLKEDEARVRQVSVLPIITRNYFNSTDDIEVAISVIVNPLPYGVRPYTYIYSLGAEKDSEGNDVPVMTLDQMISDVCDASTATEENIIMTFVSEGNDSDITEDDIIDRYWEYQMANYIKIESYSKADAQGKLVKVFDRKMVYLQTQGNQQDDASVMTYVHNGKPCIIYPYYEKVFYNPYTADSDMTQALPNNLVVELYELNDPAKGFEMTQSTKIPMAMAGEDDVIASYYGVGSFSYTDDILYGTDGKAGFIVTRRDYVASSDSERVSYFIYNADGSVRNTLFEGAASHSRLSDLDGFDPMELFITFSPTGDYIFNFVNMTTLQTELSMNYGLVDEYSDEPDYMMANLDRVKVGNDFMYAVEMRMPEYDDINDVNFMRVAWLTRQGDVHHVDRINMGNLVNYATIYIHSATLDANYFHHSPENEYMILIKRAFSYDSTMTEEQLLIGQAASAEHPQGQDLLLLGTHPQYGALLNIMPYINPNRLSVTYAPVGSDTYTTMYYDLPLNRAGVDAITVDSDSNAPAEYFNLQGIRVANPAAGQVVIRRQGSHVTKELVK